MFISLPSYLQYDDSRLSDLQPDAKVNKIKTHQTEVMPNILNDSPNSPNFNYYMKVNKIGLEFCN